MAGQAVAAASSTIDLQGWDAVNAALFDTVNASIAKQGKTPADFKLLQSGFLNTDIAGTWSAWKLVSGSAGATIAVALPIATGTASFDDPKAFAALNPATIGNLTLSNNNLTVTGSPSGATGSAFGTEARSTGKYYFELTVDSLAISSVGATQRMSFGIAPANASNADFGTDARAYAYNSDGYAFSSNADVNFTVGGKPTAGASWAKVGDTVGVAVDFDARKIWFRGPDGAWQGDNADPVSGNGSVLTLNTASGPLVPAIACAGPSQATINLGASAFKFAVPKGFNAGFNQRIVVGLDGAMVAGTVTLKSVPANGTAVNLMTDESSIIVKSVTLKDGSAADAPIVQAFDDWLTANIVNFTNVFHTIDIGGKTATGSLAFVAPTDFAYAAADVPGTSNSILALLTVTENRPKSSLVAQVSPSLVANMPKGSNAVLAISRDRLIEKILLPGIKAIANDQDSGNYVLDATSGSVTNGSDITGREMLLADGSKIVPKIPAGGLMLAIEGRKIKLTYTGVSFDIPGAVLFGHEYATFSFSQTMYLKPMSRTDGKHVLVPTFGDPTVAGSDESPRVENFIIDVNLDATARGVNIFFLVTGIVLSLVTLGLVAKAGFAIRAASAQAKVANAGAVELQPQPGQGPGPVAAASNYGQFRGALPGYEAAEAALGGTVSDRVVMSYFPPAPEANPPVGAVVPPGAAAAIDAGALQLLVRSAVKLSVGAFFATAFTVADWTLFGLNNAKDLVVDDVNKLPAAATVESLLDKALANFEWPDTKSFKLDDVELNDALMFYGTLS